MPKKFTMQEFYELVWSKPIIQIAKDFALSDVAIHKICKKHDVPKPPQGWWAKKAHGKKVIQTPLPKLGTGISDSITIVEGSLLHESDTLKQAREQARIAASAVAEQADQPRHKIVEKTLAALGKAKPGPMGLVTPGKSGCIKAEIAPASLDRLGEILDRIVAAVSIQGFELVVSEDGALLVGHDESLKFQIVETTKRIKHELTPKELAEEERERKRRERDGWFSSHLFRSRFPEWDYIPSGQLSFELEEIYFSTGTAPRRVFKDGKVQRLEKMADEIAVGIVVYAAARKEKRRQDEEWQRRCAEEQRLREIAQRRAHVEKRRSEELDAVLLDLEKLEHLRALVNSLRAGLTTKAEGRIAEFVRWAGLQLQQAEKQLDAQGLHQRFESKRIFGDDDDHGFYPNRW